LFDAKHFYFIVHAIMTSQIGRTPDHGRHAVVAVILEESKFLIIRRSELVRAPGLLCFPGGGIEPGEDLTQALHRELHEELSLQVEIGAHLWTSITRWGTKLEWLACKRCEGSVPVASPAEVAEVLWMSKPELTQRSDLLGSIPDFFEAMGRGFFQVD
jgi:8-oxo-dGTP diphosphatase